ncbi:DUF2798 domain-containing protein [Xanthomonas campestris]|nr:DUF2798 domain-containing protein [Xanthomonas campestris]
MSSTPTAVARTRWKLGVRATPFVFAFYMAAIMALLMCLVITGANTGLAAGYLWRVLDAYRIAMPLHFAVCWWCAHWSSNWWPGPCIRRAELRHLWLPAAAGFATAGRCCRAASRHAGLRPPSWLAAMIPE